MTVLRFVGDGGLDVDFRRNAGNPQVIGLRVEKVELPPIGTERPSFRPA